MNIWTNEEKKWEEKDSLWEAFLLEQKLNKKFGEENASKRKLAYVMAFVGGGGKTSSVYRLAAEAVRQNKKVIVMTTTHMLLPKENCVFLEGGSIDFRKIERKLEEEKFVIVGKNENGRKMSFVGEDVYNQLLKMADLVLTEADGSRHFPIKVPASHEPVIPKDTAEIVCICGLSCYGKEASDVCFRLEEAKKLISNCHADADFDTDLLQTMKEKEIIFLMREGYLKLLREKEKNAKVSLMLTQADSETLQKVGREIFDKMQEKGMVVEKLPLVSEYRAL